MSFDTLIWLGLTLLFVIAPLFGNKGKGDQKQQPRQPGQRPGQAPAQGQPRTRTGVPREQTVQSHDDALESRLEEARRRIEEAVHTESSRRSQQQGQSRTVTQPTAKPAGAAMQRQAAAGQPAAQMSRAAPAATPAPAARQAPPAQPGRQQPPRQRPSPTADRQPAAASRRASGQGPSASTGSTGSELQITRLDRQPTYTVRRGRQDDRGLFGSQSIMHGIVWNQILSEPPHRRANRRRTSRLRSP